MRAWWFATQAERSAGDLAAAAQQQLRATRAELSEAQQQSAQRQQQLMLAQQQLSQAAVQLSQAQQQSAGLRVEKSAMETKVSHLPSCGCSKGVRGSATAPCRETVLEPLEDTQVQSMSQAFQYGQTRSSCERCLRQGFETHSQSRIKEPERVRNKRELLRTPPCAQTERANFLVLCEVTFFHVRSGMPDWESACEFSTAWAESKDPSRAT